MARFQVLRGGAGEGRTLAEDLGDLLLCVDKVLAHMRRDDPQLGAWPHRLSRWRDQLGAALLLLHQGQGLG